MKDTKKSFPFTRWNTRISSNVHWLFKEKTISLSITTEISISWTSPVVKTSNSFGLILSNLKSLLYIYVRQHYLRINTNERKAMKERIGQSRTRGNEKISKIQERNEYEIKIKYKDKRKNNWKWWMKEDFPLQCRGEFDCFHSSTRSCQQI